jgi:hypothetical protein
MGLRVFLCMPLRLGVAIMLSVPVAPVCPPVPDGTTFGTALLLSGCGMFLRWVLALRLACFVGTFGFANRPSGASSLFGMLCAWLLLLLWSAVGSCFTNRALRPRPLTFLASELPWLLISGGVFLPLPLLPCHRRAGALFRVRTRF